MSLKNLHQFVYFDFERFLTGKEFLVTASKPWLDHGTKALLGTAVELAITKDETPYRPQKDGAVQSNLWEKFWVKVPKSISVPVGASVTVIEGVATVYGDYRNQLSVKAADIQVVKPPDSK